MYFSSLSCGDVLIGLFFAYLVGFCGFFGEEREVVQAN